MRQRRRCLPMSASRLALLLQGGLYLHALVGIHTYLNRITCILRTCAKGLLGLPGPIVSFHDNEQWGAAPESFVVAAAASLQRAWAPCKWPTCLLPRFICCSHRPWHVHRPTEEECARNVCTLYLVVCSTDQFISGASALHQTVYIRKPAVLVVLLLALHIAITVAATGNGITYTLH